jgi:S-DNA-T family DNA segregation ATPase FtsK/SpoIIIE
LATGAALLANAFDGLAEEQWSRTMLYGFPGPAKRDVEWMGHHSLHEMVHHRADITRLLSDV